jgi:2-hydroxychromene-2-carboxylate isomerase
MRPTITRILSTAVTSHTARDLRRAIHAARRRIAGRNPTVHYFHQVDDPYSHLAAQLCGPLAARYRLDLVPWLAPPPDDEATPERARLRAYALRDAGTLAQRFRLDYPQLAQYPAPERIAEAQAILVAAIRNGTFANVAPTVGSALWRGDGKSLNDQQGLANAARDEVERALADGEALRRRLGHYFSAMFYFEGEWYWGVDRLHHLETRLGALGLDSRANQPPLAPYQKETLAGQPSTGRRPVIEFWFSFRSPYCYIGMARFVRLARHYGADLQLRFIQPMVMRGLPVPFAKQMYIMHDTKREADGLGLPYGTTVDPRGPGIERANAVLYRAIALGQGERFAEGVFAGVFARGVDFATDEGLFTVARECGLRDDDVRSALADESWRAVAEKNRLTLFDAGFWGAPTFRVDGMPGHWGQDRIWALEDDVVAAIARAQSK